MSRGTKGGPDRNCRRPVRGTYRFFFKDRWGLFMRGWLAMLTTLGGLFGAAGVALAAIGAHRAANPNVTTAAYFFLFHAGGLIALCAMCRRQASLSVLLAGSIIAAGVILFSGDLALRALADVTLVRLAAPTGGVLMILGWLTAAITLPMALLRDPA